MIDRCQAFWCEKYLLHKDIPGPHGRKGLLLVAAGMKKDDAVKCATPWPRSSPDHQRADARDVSALGADAKGDVLSHTAALRKPTKRETAPPIAPAP